MTVDFATQWAALYSWDDLDADDRPRKKKYDSLPELVLVVHRWPSAEGAAVQATLTVYECDDPTFADLFQPRDTSKDVPVAKLALTLKPNPKAGEDEKAPRVIAALRKVRGTPWLDRTLKRRHRAASERKADVALRIGASVVLLSLPKEDIHDEARDGKFEIGFSLEVAGEPAFDLRSTWGLSYIDVADPLIRMLTIPQRFSDPARKPSIEPEQVVATLEERTDALLKQARGKTPEDVDLDVDGLRFHRFLRAGVTRKQVIESLMKEGGPSILGKVRERFKKSKHEGKLVLDSAWRSHDITDKAYFLIHDVGLAVSNRRAVHYSPDMARIHKTHVHGFLNWSGVLAPTNDWSVGKVGTKAARKKYKKPWRHTTIETETTVNAFYVKADSIEAFEASLKDPHADKALLPTKTYGKDDGQPYVVMTWKCPITWGERKKLGRKRLGLGAKDSAQPVHIAGFSQAAIDALVDMYVLASARAGHLLTVTCHVEVDRGLPGGHSDPTGLEMQFFYDAVTRRLNGGGEDIGLGGFQLPVGVRYGIHPRRVTGPPTIWTDADGNRIVIARNYEGAPGVKIPEKSFPHQSAPPTVS